mmetsp:Transcript_53740/g.114159  ORF Transcript_53740/g.114159 Transcript_53740/m.114159 type:complete len:368 (+) Transcript_53740:105-1208(+)|eukprot:CAMPEP_0172532558 /NCGR_PEP_ID=MMETSP1067-20121228/5561_1 /TAXON_ID=265564 ORGANISM="Thalassiosira punctigera, Strain Tpunct2005C2" /NCGR_SAMPLE_ID=MMETSP1067 /ASSEMBLY_ACC=CAM_ASM_000444 /LENGTH=367 /DNA_ID=CAMNT_0013317087 /DNA_START=97 /DNA_END=1200 /DNA_ORIENTATION=+
MTFLAVDQSSNLEDGLYTGEEICAMLGENDGDGIFTGIDQVGVEMELDPEALSSSSLTDDDDEAPAPSSSQHDVNNKQRLAALSIAERRAFATDQFIRANNLGPVPVVPIGQAVGKSLIKKSVPTKLQFIKRQMMTKASNRIKSMVHKSILPSPTSQRCIEIGRNNIDNDSLTAATSHASIVTSYTDSSKSYNSMAAPSSITTSTCDFSPDPNLHAVFQSYLMTNPWEAAKKGDYATLSYIYNHDDSNIWTQEDAHGHVPLYYACMSYSRPNGPSFGKYGLESIKLLVNAWPRNRELPRALLEHCASSGRERVHKDVVEVLSSSGKGAMNAVVLSAARRETRIEGVSNVVPVSFLEDLGDDGYVEDY